MGMMRFGHKSPTKPKVSSLNNNEVAILASKKFLKQLAADGFFSGPETSLTPALKGQLNEAFKRFIAVNRRTSQAVWALFIEHITEFTDSAFHFKSVAGSLSWPDAAALVQRHNWKGSKA